MNPALAIVIPNLHSPVIGEVLERLLEQCHALSGGAEVWVVGQDRYGQVVPGGDVHLLHTPQPVPPARARNLGAAASSGEMLLFLDADCIPQPGWLAAMLEAAARWPGAGAISGAMLPDGDTWAIHCGQVAGFHEYLPVTRPGPRRYLASFSLLVPRRVWVESGGFDEGLPFAGEDMDLTIRIARLGHALYLVPQARVRHRPQRADWRAQWAHAWQAGSQSILLRRRHAAYHGMPRWAFKPWFWGLFSLPIAAARTVQVFARPGLWRYAYCAPWVFLSKLAWCWGAAKGLSHVLVEKGGE